MTLENFSSTQQSIRQELKLMDDQLAYDYSHNTAIQKV